MLCVHGSVTGELRALAAQHGLPWRAARLKAFYRSWVPAGGLAFDLGAWAGHRVRAFRALDARVLALEPRADFARLLQTLFEGDAGVRVVCASLVGGDESGDAVESDRPLGAAPDGGRPRDARPADPDAHAHPDDAFAAGWQAGAGPAATTLDALIAAAGRPDYLKLDLGGDEPGILGGLSVPLPALSFAGQPGPACVAACLERLERLGRYRYTVSGGERLRWLQAEPLDADGLLRWLDGQPGALATGAEVYARLA